jgi:AraC-like DNA-binding protein
MIISYSLDKRVIPMGLVSNLTYSMVQSGFSEADVLAETGLSPQDLQDQDQLISYRQRIQQVENVLRLVDDPGFWLRLPASVSISDFGLLGYAMMSSATLEKAVQIAVKYHKMAGAMFELSFVEEGEHAVLRLDHLLAGGDINRFMVEDLFRGIAPLIEILLGKPFKPQQVLLNYAAAAAPEDYQNAFQCEVLFNQPYCEYRLDARLLSEPLAGADSNTAESCENACRQLLAQMEIEADLVSRICHMLLSTPGEFPRLDAIADRLSIGTRTLRRRLKSLGTSYQKILDDVKKQLAMEYLQSTTLSVQEISDLLGYSEVTNFRRAFVKWAEVYPYQYRKHSLTKT